MKKVLLFISVLTVFSFSVWGQIPIDKLNRGYQYQETFTSKVVEKFKKKLPTSVLEKQIRFHHIEAKNRIGFLNKDFRTKIFSQANRVECTDFIVERDQTASHLGVIEMSFNACSNLEKAYHTVLSSKRSNFKLKVLTQFSVLKRSHSLLFIYSETPSRSEISSFFEEMNHFEEGKVACEG